MKFCFSSEASKLADEYFKKGNGSRAHTLAAIGNCHIDTAWLWPYSETKRKVARSYSSQLKIMEDYPEHIFVASQVIDIFYMFFFLSFLTVILLKW